MITPPATSLVRIRKENGFVVGAGFLIDNEQHLLTCAHVVARACNCDPYQHETPQATILLDSPFLKSERLLKARVVFWQPIQDDGSGDIAGLELLDDLPIGSEAVSFAPAEYLWDHDFRVYGFPKGDDDGIWATGRLLERQGTGWIQIDDTKTEGFAVVEGFSGGPVWDIQLEGVVGMVVAASTRLEAKTAFAIPLDVLAEAWPLLKTTVHQRQRQYLFVSACPDDVDYVVRLSAELTKSEITVWHEQHLPGGNHTDLQKRLQQAIRAAQVVVLALSPQTSSWQTVREHLRLADLYSRRLIQVWVSDDEPPAHRYSSSALQTAWVDTRTTPHEVVLQAIKSNLSQQRTITGLLDPFSVEDLPWEPRNPYKGLRAFREDDKDDFFGRDDLVSELLTDIEKMLAVEPSAENQGRFLTLIGPSGSGKSSVVMAGLLPQLKQGGKLTHSEQWVYLTPIVPGEHPLQALVNTLRPHLPDIEPEILQKKLETGSTLALHQLIIPLVKQWGTRVVLVVDQFEELFTQTRSQDEQRRFIELLQVAATEPGGPLLVLLTLRADFYHRLMEYPEFYQLVTPRMKPLLPLKVEALRKTIVQPALASDVQLIFEGTLIGDLLFEVQGQTGALPLLQFALEQLFERRNGHRITLRAYRDIEGVKGALKLHAEKTYSALPSETHRKLAQALFLRLIEPGNAEQETSRRRTDLTEFAFDDIHQTNLMQETIDALVNARLLTINGNKHAETVTSESNQKALISTRAKTTTIEVSHEALITEWPLLKSWVSEARKDLPLQHAIREDAADWEQNNRPADRLYRGTQLKEARAWATRNIASRQEQAFLRASATRRVRSVMMVLVVLLLVVASSGIAGWLALHQPPDPRYVTNADNDGVGSLRWAIANTPIGDTITFDPRLIGKAIVLKSADIHTGSKKLKIQGLGKERLVIGSKNNINVIIDPGASVIISDVAFKGSSLVIANEGGFTLTNSTVSGNSTAGFGGGISISPETDPLFNLSAVVRFCTIYNNPGTELFGDDGIWIDQSIEPTRVRIHASIVAGKPNDMTSVISGKFTSDDYNLIQASTQAGFKPAPHDQSVSGSNLSKLFNVQEGLRKNGGPTATYKLFSSKDNPAINIIPLDVCHVKDIFDKGRQEYIDQRGMPRPGGKKQRCDIGAYESSG